MTKKKSQPRVRLGIFENRYTYDEIKVGSKTGETLMAVDEQTLEFVVIKRPSLTQPNPDLRKASIVDLAREEKALCTGGIQDHPAVCRLLHAGEASWQGGAYRYLVLERARGTPLPELIGRYHAQGQPVPEPLSLDIARQLLDLLAAAHRAGVVYNDIKVDHLFWDETAQQLKLIDWGNARFTHETSAVTPMDDVFQCGELLYEFITGEKYARVTLREWAAAGRPTWEVSVYQPVAPELKQLISRALHPDPKQRYASAETMANDLNAYTRRREREARETSETVQPAPASIQEYRDWLSADAGPHEFGAWLMQSSAYLEQMLQSSSRSPELVAELGRVQALQARWNLVREAAQKLNIQQLQFEVIQVHNQIAAAGFDAAVVAVGERLRRVAQAAPWRFLDAPEFVVRCDQLAEAVGRGTVEIEALQPLWEAASQVAHSDAEKDWGKYFRNLGEAQIALAAGQLDVAANTLRRAEDAPVHSDYWDQIFDFYETAQAIVRGEEDAARKEFEALLERYGLQAKENPLVKLYAESLDALPHLKAVLELFVTSPERGWSRIELPTLLRNSTVNHLSAYSYAVQAGLNHCREGRFASAVNTFEQVFTDMLHIPPCWGVELRSASKRVQTYLIQARRCEEELDHILAHVEACREQNKPLDEPAIRERLSKIEPEMPRAAERPAGEPDRPGIWLQAFDELTGLAHAGAEAADLMICLEDQGIGEQEPIYPLFRQLVAWHSAAVEREVSPAVAETPPKTKKKRRRVPHRTRLTRNLRAYYQQYAVAAIALVAVIAGVVVVGLFASNNREAATEESVAEAPTSMAAPIPTPIPVSTTANPTPTTDLVQAVCDAIVVAEQAQQWQQVLEQVLYLEEHSQQPEVACGDQPVAQIAAQAHFQLGRQAYDVADFSGAIQHWTAAMGRHPIPGVPIDLLVECATAREASDPVRFEGLVAEFGAEEIESLCGFDPYAYLPTAESVPARSPLLEIDLLAAMADRRVPLFMNCSQSTCPAIYQDNAQQWHFNNFFWHSEAYLLLDNQFQIRSTGQTWEEGIRSVGIEFAIVSNQPNSFPYQARVGLEIRATGSEAVLLLLTSQPVLSAAASVVVPDSGDLACEIAAASPYIIIDEEGEFVRHTLSFGWDPSGELQLFVDGQAVCKEPIRFPSAPEVALYLAGRGTHLGITQLSVAVDSS